MSCAVEIIVPGIIPFSPLQFECLEVAQIERPVAVKMNSALFLLCVLHCSIAVLLTLTGTVHSCNYCIAA